MGSHFMENTSLLNSSFQNNSILTPTEIPQTVHFAPSWGVLKFIQISSYILIAVIGSVGNFLTILVLLKPQNRSKTSSILLLNLAICDACISAIGIPLDLGELIPGTWFYGAMLCNVIYPFQTSLPMVSSWTLMFMLAERNMIFSKHITTGLRARAVRFLAVVTWVLPLALVVPYGFKLSIEPGILKGSYVCGENWNRPVDRQIFTIALFVTEYLVPIVAITLFVTNIGTYLRRERKSVRKNALGLDQRTSKRRLRTNIRLTMIFIVIVSLYAALKLPNNVFWLWVEFGGGDKSEHFDTIWTSVGLSSYSTSMTNPFVLGAMSADFRKEFIHILSCRFCCCCALKVNNNNFSPFTSTTIVSYKRIKKMDKVTVELNGSDKNRIPHNSNVSAFNGQPKSSPPTWKQNNALGRSSNRRKTVKYKYDDLLPDSGLASPLESPSKPFIKTEIDRPLVENEYQIGDVGKLHVVSITTDHQSLLEEQIPKSPTTLSDNIATTSTKKPSFESPKATCDSQQPLFLPSQKTSCLAANTAHHSCQKIKAHTQYESGTQKSSVENCKEDKTCKICSNENLNPSTGTKYLSPRPKKSTLNPYRRNSLHEAYGLFDDISYTTDINISCNRKKSISSPNLSPLAKSESVANDMGLTKNVYTNKKSSTDSPRSKRLKLTHLLSFNKNKEEDIVA